MDQTADDSSSISGESSRGGSLYAIWNLIVFFNGKGQGLNRTEPLSSAKKKKFL